LTPQSELLDAIQDAKLGSEEAFNLIRKAAAPVIGRLAAKYPTYERDEIESLALLGLWDAVTSYRSGGGSTFLYYAKMAMEWRVINDVRFHAQKRRVPSHLVPMVDIPDIPSPDKATSDVAEDNCLVRDICSIVRTKLSPGDQELFHLYFEADKTTTEIARELGISYGAAYNRVRRMINRIKRHTRGGF
jgi:RNA polymerase sigma factor (sigma-70 family)